MMWIRAEEGGRSLQISRGDNEDDDTLLYVPNLGLVHLESIWPRYIPKMWWRTKNATQPPSEWTEIQVWAWMVVAALATYPTIAFIRGPVRRWRRHRKGLCLKCGYDLTGNESGVCPECGDAR